MHEAQARGGSVTAVGHNGSVRRSLIVVLLAVLVLAPLGRAERLPLTTRLANALAVRGISAASSGAIAVDLATGRTLFARN